MRIDELPTNDDWSEHDWEQVFPTTDEYRSTYTGSSAYSGTHFAPLGAQAPDITPERIAEVVGWQAHSPEGGGSVNFCCVVRLTDGTWAACMAWADYTGWGCQDGVEWRVAASLPDIAAYGLDQSGRLALGYTVEGTIVDRKAIEA